MIDPVDIEADERRRHRQEEGGRQIPEGPPCAEADTETKEPLCDQVLQVPGPCGPVEGERDQVKGIPEARLPLAQEREAPRVVAVPQRQLALPEHGLALDHRERNVVPEGGAHVGLVGIALLAPLETR